VEVLASAISYALEGAALATPARGSLPTPCTDWDLDTLLEHLSDSMEALHEAIASGGVGASAAASHAGPRSDPVARLRGRAARLLAACGAVGPAGRLVAIGDRDLTTHMVALAGAIEISVHGWDIAVTCGVGQPVPPGLAAILLPVAPPLITPATRPGLFADPVRLPGPASPGDQLVAFLGRQPRVLAARGSGRA
jgi:uncharacterized protein (TIGR03086 family)